MTPADAFAAYEALLARALRYAAGVGERGPACAEPFERWLNRFGDHLRLQWLDDTVEAGLEVRALLIPLAAFEVADDALAALIDAERLKIAARRDANADAFDAILKGIFNKQG